MKPEKELHEYLVYLWGLPETRKNTSLRDCIIHLIQETPDTEESLNGTVD